MTPATNDQLTAPGSTDPATDDNSYIESPTAKPRGKPFARGDDERRNADGRPPKGESVPELLAKAYEKKRKQLVKAAIDRALRDDQVGNRAFNDGLDRVYGKVADEMHITTEDSPLLGFLMRHTAQLPYVEGESRDITTTDSAQTQSDSRTEQDV